MRGIIISFLFGFGLTLYAFAASGQRRYTPCPERSDHEIRAILTWHEAGATAFDDLRAIHAVISNIAREHGLTYAEAACRHSGRALRGETNRSWLGHVTDACTEPAFWPRVTTRHEPGPDGVLETDDDIVSVHPHPPWSAWEDRCRALMREARLVAAEPLVCSTAMTWGNDSDLVRREALTAERGWREVACVRAPGVELRQSYGVWARVETREIDPD